MKRGDLVTIAVSGNYGKPRPALVVQADGFAALPAVTVLQLTSEVHDEHLVRITVQPTAGNGLRKRPVRLSGTENRHKATYGSMTR
jgi:mRNA interferase MazF